MYELSTLVTYLLLVAGSYLLGSAPTGVIVARLYRNVDLTQVGSQRTGATNVARTLGVGAGAIVLAGDLAKGILAVWIASQFIGSPVALGIAWVMALLGHTHSIFLHLRGGRGVGTGLGGLAVVSFPLFAAAVTAGLLVVIASRYVSLGSLTGTMLTLVVGPAVCLTGRLPTELIPFFVIAPAIVLWAHRDNIARLRAGEERRFGQQA
ncbi:MAG: glycerol-3-phosphate 1-O-acyltransferase [Chloroflexi bacterium]|nr:glycerol-3-phosphate 1-O-acyltransferase [Chloroflexota bacterium]